MNTTTQDDIDQHKASGSWLSLMNKALGFIEKAQRNYPDEISWTLGGGTRLMLEYGHRISHDIDIFIPEASLEGFFTPRLADYISGTSSYVEDHLTVKLIFGKIGEIDFIFYPPLVDSSKSFYAQDPRIVLESVEEVIAKKLFYRAENLTPRDLFDWWYVSNHDSKALSSAAFLNIISSKFEDIEKSIDRLSQPHQADLPSLMSSWDKLLSPHLPPQREALSWAKKEIKKYKNSHLVFVSDKRKLS